MVCVRPLGWLPGRGAAPRAVVPPSTGWILPSTLERIICFIQSINSKANLF